MSRDRSLSLPRVVHKAAIGVVSRLGQGLLLAFAVPMVPAVEASDAAVVLAVSIAVNLMTNVGLPTLMVRGWRQGWDNSRLMGLARAYAWLSVVGCLATFVILLPLTEAHGFAIVGGILCMTQSLFYGLEYWELGRSNRSYDRFLRGPATAQAIASLAGPILLIISRDALAGLVGLVASFALGILIHTYRRKSRTRIAFFGPLLWREWISTALGIGVGTVAIAALYSADAVVLKALASAEVMANYRLAVMVVGFTVALVPVSMFVLADVAGGKGVDYRALTLLSAAIATICALAGVILHGFSHEFFLTGSCLLALSPIAAIRLLTQVFVGDLNARGWQYWVAAIFSAGVFAWFGFAARTQNVAASDVVRIGLAQVALEFLLLALLCLARVSLHRRARHGGSLEVAPLR